MISSLLAWGCHSPLLTLPSSWMVQLPEPFGFIFTWFAALPLILFLAQALTKAIVQDFLILKVLSLGAIYYSLWHKCIAVTMNFLGA
jgi:hypothetical protein